MTGTTTIYEMEAIWLQDRITNQRGFRISRLLPDMRVGIDALRGKLIDWDKDNDFKVLSMSGTVSPGRLWVDLENQFNNRQVTIQIQ